MNTEHFTSDVLDTLTSTYLVDGQAVEGQAVSSVLEILRGRRGMPLTKSQRVWRGFSCLAALESLLRQQGFKVAYGKNTRGQKAIVVTL